MQDLEEQMLKGRIAKVEEDISQLTTQGDSARKIEVLSEYKKYLEDELRQLKHENNKKA